MGTRRRVCLDPAAAARAFDSPDHFGLATVRRGCPAAGKCSNLQQRDDDGHDEKYTSCVEACEQAAADAAAAFGGITDEPPCYQDMVRVREKTYYGALKGLPTHF